MLLEVVHLGLILFIFSFISLFLTDKLRMHHSVKICLVILIMSFLGLYLTKSITMSIYPLIIGSILTCLIGYLLDRGLIQRSFSLLGQLFVIIYLIYSGVFVDFSFMNLDDYILWGGLVTIAWYLLIMNTTKFVSNSFKIIPEVMTIIMLALAVISYSKGLTTGLYISVFMVFIFLALSLYQYRSGHIALDNSTSLLIGYLVASYAVLGMVKGPFVISFLLPLVMFSLVTMVRWNVIKQNRIRAIVNNLINSDHIKYKKLVIISLSIVMGQFAVIYYLL